MASEVNDYTGVDNLELMTQATNYNSFLVNRITSILDQSHLTVDFGAGIGLFAKEVQHIGYNVICVEQDPYLIKELQACDLFVIKGIEDLPKNKKTSVYSLNVLEHIENDQEIIEQIYNAMSDGGQFYLYLPAFSILYSSMDKKVGHFRRYRKNDLTQKLKKAGFIIESARYVDSIGFFVTILFKLIGNNDGDINELSLKIYDRFIFPLSRVLDFFLSPFVGKNIEVIARRDG